MGVILRYYLYGLTEGATTNAQIEALYERQQINPATLEIVGTFAPLYENETIFTTPTGRLMVCNQPQIQTPGTNNNGAPIRVMKNTTCSPWPRQYCGRTATSSRQISSGRFQTIINLAHRPHRRQKLQIPSSILATCHYTFRLVQTAPSSARSTMRIRFEETRQAGFLILISPRTRKRSRSWQMRMLHSN